MIYVMHYVHICFWSNFCQSVIIVIITCRASPGRVCSTCRLKNPLAWPDLLRQHKWQHNCIASPPHISLFIISEKADGVMSRQMLSLPSLVLEDDYIRGEADDEESYAQADDEESYAKADDPSPPPSLPPEAEPSFSLPSLPLTDSEMNESLLSILTDRNFDQSVQEMFNESYVDEERIEDHPEPEFEVTVKTVKSGKKKGNVEKKSP